MNVLVSLTEESYGRKHNQHHFITEFIIKQKKSYTSWRYIAYLALCNVKLP
jgi:hypothetical protein